MSSRLPLAAAFSILPSLVGCARYHAAPISASANARALASRSFADPRLLTFIRASLPPGTAEPLPWNLGTLTLAALYFQPDLAIARSRLAVAHAAVATARQIPNPALGLSPLYNLNIPTPTPWTIGAAVNFLIETFGKRGARTAQARALAEAARWDLATAGWQVRTRMRGALLAMWAAGRRLDLARGRLRLQSELVGLLQQRFAAGQASALDLERARIARAELELALRGLERAEAAARAQLAAALGVPAGALDAIRISLAEFEAAPGVPGDGSGSALRERAMTTRSDVRASLAEYRAAESALRLQVANQYPNLTIGAEYNWGAIQEQRTSSQIGLPASFELPLFNQNQGPLAEAAARRRQAAANVTAVQARAMGQVDAAAADIAAARRTLATARALSADAAGRLARVQTAFRAGAVDRPTLVSVEIERAAAAASLLEAEAAQRQALGALEDALQQPLYDPALWPIMHE